MNKYCIFLNIKTNQLTFKYEQYKNLKCEVMFIKRIIKLIKLIDFHILSKSFKYIILKRRRSFFELRFRFQSLTSSLLRESKNSMTVAIINKSNKNSLNINFISATKFNVIAQRKRKQKKNLQLYSLIIA